MDGFAAGISAIMRLGCGIIVLLFLALVTAIVASVKGWAFVAQAWPVVLGVVMGWAFTRAWDAMTKDY